MTRERIFLGRGALTWCGSERRSDRYGAVSFDESYGCVEVVEENKRPAVGTRGKLIAVIREVRESHHIGDLFRGIFPGGAEVGQEHVLGEGTVFYADWEWAELAIGLQPAEFREADWLDPHKLYICHDQTVDLFFEVGNG